MKVKLLKRFRKRFTWSYSWDTWNYTLLDHKLKRSDKFRSSFHVFLEMVEREAGAYCLADRIEKHNRRTSRLKYFRQLKFM